MLLLPIINTMINVKKAFILSGLAKKGDSHSSIELIKAGVWGLYPQPLRDFHHSTIIIKTQHIFTLYKNLEKIHIIMVKLKCAALSNSKAYRDIVRYL